MPSENDNILGSSAEINLDNAAVDQLRERQDQLESEGFAGDGESPAEDHLNATQYDVPGENRQHRDENWQLRDQQRAEREEEQASERQRQQSDRVRDRYCRSGIETYPDRSMPIIMATCKRPLLSFGHGNEKRAQQRLRPFLWVVREVRQPAAAGWMRPILPDAD